MMSKEEKTLTHMLQHQGIYFIMSSPHLREHPMRGLCPLSAHLPGNTCRRRSAISDAAHGVRRCSPQSVAIMLGLIGQSQLPGFLHFVLCRDCGVICGSTGGSGSLHF